VNGHFSPGESDRRSGNACRSLQIIGVGKNIRRVCQPDAGGRFKNCLWHIGRRLRICDSFPSARANIHWEKRADFPLLIGGVSFRLPPCGRPSAQKPLDFHSRDFSSWTAGRHHFSAEHLQAFVLRSKRCDSVPFKQFPNGSQRITLPYLDFDCRGARILGRASPIPGCGIPTGSLTG